MSVSIADRHAITDLMHRFYRLVDHGRAAEIAGLFTADARMVMGAGTPKPMVVEGDAIRAWAIDRGAMTQVTTRHVVSNMALEARGDGSVAVSSLVTLFRADGDVPRTTPASLVADIDEVFVRAGDGWRIHERIVTPIFTRA